MTNKARIVIEDCRNALGDLYDEPNGMKWRVIWVGTVTLLRTVGHVLHKVDSEISAEMKKVIDEWWGALKLSKPKPEIFWGFIEDDRNYILKQYKFRASVGVDINVPFHSIGFNGEVREAGSIDKGNVEYNYVITDGPFKGKDQRDLVKEAIEWWENQLGEIDIRVAALRIEKLDID
jgi:hypothetical protein